MGVLEGVGTSQHVVYLLPFQVHLVLKLGLNAVNVGASSAEEAEVVNGLLRKQDVRARRAEKHPKSCVAVGLLSQSTLQLYSKLSFYNHLH